MQTTSASSAAQQQHSGSTHSSFIKHNTQHAHTILDEVLDRSPKVHWDDIAGLQVAKQILQAGFVYMRALLARFPEGDAAEPNLPLSMKRAGSCDLSEFATRSVHGTVGATARSLAVRTSWNR